MLFILYDNTLFIKERKLREGYGSPSSEEEKVETHMKPLIAAPLFKLSMCTLSMSIFMPLSFKMVCLRAMPFLLLNYTSS